MHETTVTMLHALRAFGEAATAAKLATKEEAIAWGYARPGLSSECMSGFSAWVMAGCPDTEGSAEPLPGFGDLLDELLADVGALPPKDTMEVDGVRYFISGIPAYSEFELRRLRATLSDQLAPHCFEVISTAVGRSDAGLVAIVAVFKSTNGHRSVVTRHVPMPQDRSSLRFSGATIDAIVHAFTEGCEPA